MEGENKNLRYKDKIKCDICGKTISYSNKWKHNQSQVHKFALLAFKEKLKNRI
jgi:hypothetical protein